MAAAIEMVSGAAWIQHNKNGMMRKMRNGNKKQGMRMRVRVSAFANLTDKFKTLKVNPGASESEVKKAFRRLALQYHPDVCKGSNCGVQFNQINEAYDVVMSYLRGETQDYGLYNSVDQEEVFVYDDSICGKNGWFGKVQELGTTLLISILTSNLVLDQICSGTQFPLSIIMCI